MFLSKLILSRTSPDVLRDLGSAYEMHRTIMRAFGSPAGRVLFRLEMPRDDADAPVVLVQSEFRPDWAFAVAAGYARVLGPKQLALKLAVGRRLRFRLLANPAVKRDGKRTGLMTSELQEQWVRRKAAECGFEIIESAITRSGKQVSTRRPRSGGIVFTHAYAEYEGYLRVSNVERFSAALLKGVGPAKGFGFGLLSVASA